ncbi:hypothetical protein [Rheinheimera sp. 4Y26]|uniref:hypothetical protein n=1 Tax=Rheinheimera sp. 4Y26 TaxID=2977811 RepID=UPI0021B09A34|nr:hypothetical protein [Rheinheimera sp. 4Y26]MCT6699776.1 hypothetical protein [Rheinheimera sp. 4Y26]
MKVKLGFLLFLLFSQFCCAETVIEIDAAPEKGFYFPFLLKIPEVTKTKYLIVETNNTGKVSDNFDEHYTNAKSAISGNAIGPWLSTQLNAPILIPVFPRGEQDWQTYTHALDRDTLLIDAGKLKRIDLQLLAMIKEAKKLLLMHSVRVNEKVIMTGFSASGTFANRFSLLHPDSIKLVVAGGLNGILMLPVSSLKEQKLNYPLGLNDFEAITGGSFAHSTWKVLPQFLFMGANDTNDAAKYDDAYSESERQVIFSVMGSNMQPERWQLCQQMYLKFNANVVFKTYKGIGHGTNLQIHNDILAFINNNI